MARLNGGGISYGKVWAKRQLPAGTNAKQEATMRVLFDIVHPAQVHFFKNVISALQRRGDEVLVTAREKDVTLDLLRALGIKHVCISHKASSLLGMAVELISRDVRLMKLARLYEPDVMVARVGVSVGPVGRFLDIPTVIYDDMEQARLQAAIGMTFATYICTGLGYFRDLGKRQIRFRGLPVLSYLDPRYFQPNVEAVRNAGLEPEVPYIFVRTVSWAANHDFGRGQTRHKYLAKAVGFLSRFGRVIISSEGPLTCSLRQYKNPAPVDCIHHVLAFARLCLVEGGTMAAEAAALGIPTICWNTYDFGYLRALEGEYGLVFRCGSLEQILDIAGEFLRQPDVKLNWLSKRKRLLDESDDVAQFMLDMVDRAVLENAVGKASGQLK